MGLVFAGGAGVATSSAKALSKFPAFRKRCTIVKMNYPSKQKCAKFLRGKYPDCDVREIERIAEGVNGSIPRAVNPAIYILRGVLVALRGGFPPKPPSPSGGRKQGDPKNRQNPRPPPGTPPVTILRSKVAATQLWTLGGYVSPTTLRDHTSDRPRQT